jgi:hypothetical protein
MGSRTAFLAALASGVKAEVFLFVPPCWRLLLVGSLLQVVVLVHFLLDVFAFTALLDEFELIMLMMKEGRTCKGTCCEIFSYQYQAT